MYFVFFLSLRFEVRDFFDSLQLAHRAREEAYTASLVLTCSNPSIIDPIGSLFPDLTRLFNKIVDLQLFLPRHETVVSRGAIYVVDVRLW